MNFNIDPEFLTSITVKTDHAKAMPEDEQLLLKLKGYVNMSIKTEDHPEFTKLREQLCADGYIKVERRWWNGDIVVKPFTLNGSKFKKDDRFVCASAMGYHLTSRYKK